jgi:hypothetical protein
MFCSLIFVLACSLLAQTAPSKTPARFTILVAPGGAVLKTYLSCGSLSQDFALNLDPNGTDFWTADLANGEVYEVNIATGAIDNQWASNGASFGGVGTTGGLVVFGQITASGGGGGGGTTSTPEPGTLGLLASGLLGLLALCNGLKAKAVA